MYRTNWGIGHSMKEILEAHKGPFTGEGHKGLYEILTTSWHAQLAMNLALLGSLTHHRGASYVRDASLSLSWRPTTLPSCPCSPTICGLAVS